MNRQEQDYNAGYKQAVEDMEKLMLQLRDYKQAVDAAEWRDLGSNSREYKDGYHDALQKLYNLFKCLPISAKEVAKCEPDSIMIRSVNVLSGSIAVDGYKLVPYHFEFAETGCISAKDIEIFDKVFDLQVAATEEEEADNFTVMSVSVAAADISENADAYTGVVFKL